MNSYSTGVPWIGLICILFFLALCVACVLLLVARLFSNKDSSKSKVIPVILVGGLLTGAPLLLLVIGGTLYFSRYTRTEPAVVTRADSIPSTVQPLTRPSSNPAASPGVYRRETPIQPLPPSGTEVVIHPDPNAISTVQLPSPPMEWLSSDLKAFDADVYPGLQQAAGPLGRRIRETLEANRLLQNSPADDSWVEPQQIIISVVELSEENRSSVLAQFSEEIRNDFPKSSISVSNSSTSAPFGNMVALHVRDQNEALSFAPWDPTHMVQSNGSLHCEAKTQAGQAEVSLKYVEKPWLESFETFAMERPNKQFIAGYSTSLASSESDARREAMNDASEKLKQAGFVQFKLDETLSTDRFVQKLSRPYGDVWRVAFLFDLSSPPVAAHAIATMNSHVKTNQLYHFSFFSIALSLFLITIVLGVVLNLLTFGYYRVQIGLGWAFAALGLITIGGLLLIA